MNVNAKGDARKKTSAHRLAKIIINSDLWSLEVSSLKCDKDK